MTEEHRNRVLVVDDDEDVRSGMASYLRAHGLDTSVAESCRTGESVFRSERVDVILVDHVLPDGDSLGFLSAIRKIDPRVPVIVITGFGTVDLAVRALRQGAHDVLTKPLPMSAVHGAVRSALEARPPDLSARRGLDALVGESDVMVALRRDVAAMAGADCPVLILGETGSGKGVVARAIHDVGERSRGPFVDLNCAALSKEFVESELFGHTRGAFTGAHAMKTGLFEVADGGTLFLDEIGDIDAAVQPKLLKAIEDKKFRRMGEVRDRFVDVRLVAATHHPLASRSNTTFRRDLFYRISTMTIEVPPLRARGQDIVLLARQFLALAGSRQERATPTLAVAAERKLLSHCWPGNVRELRNVMDRAMFLATEGTVRPEDIRIDGGIAPSDAPPSSGPAISSSYRVLAETASMTLEDVERYHIERVLAEVDGDMAAAAKRLGIARSTLYQKIKLFGLRRSDHVSG
jgi:DNA-binding NtrC family response regulator